MISNQKATQLANGISLIRYFHKKQEPPTKKEYKKMMMNAKNYHLEKIMKPIDI